MVLHGKEKVTILNFQFSLSKSIYQWRKAFKSIFHIYEFYILKYLRIIKLF